MGGRCDTALRGILVVKRVQMKVAESFPLKCNLSIMINKANIKASIASP